MAWRTRFWRWLGRGADIYTLVVFVLGVPALVAFLASVVTYVVRSPQEALVVGISLYAAVLAALAIAAVVARRASSRVPDLDVEPSSGPADEVRVAVTNHGRDATLRVSGRVLRRVHDSNPSRNTVYTLAWVTNLKPTLVVAHSHTENVLLAKFLILPPEGRIMERMGEMQIMEYKAEGLSVVEWMRWSFYKPYQPVLPELHLQLSFQASGYAMPLVRRYALRPAGQYGPLELVPLADPDMLQGAVDEANAPQPN